MASILIIEDRQSLRDSIARLLKKEGFKTIESADGKEGKKAISEGGYDVVLSDLKLPFFDGIELLKASMEINPDIPFIIVTGFGTVEKAVEAMKLGGYDFITKPVEPEHLILLIKRALSEKAKSIENVILKEQVQSLAPLTKIVGKSNVLQKAINLLKKIAPTDGAILILGETGVGKELFARAAHDLSPRAKGPFIAINCASIPETLLENELFGHEKGSYTGATGIGIGKFELASGGSIFLDEIGEMSPALQSKLLRVLQDGSFERIGSNKTIITDARVITATNRDLKSEVTKGNFRLDLYYRLNVLPILVPSLRERKEDIPILIEHFLDHFQKALRKKISLSKEAFTLMINYPWPGNIRELQNCIERICILFEGRVKVEDLSLTSPSENPVILSKEKPQEWLMEMLKEWVAINKNSIEDSAKNIGVSTRTFKNLLERGMP